jgi:hypothetical protein
MIDDSELEKQYREQDPELYEEVMQNLYKVTSIEEFWRKAKILSKETDLKEEVHTFFYQIFEKNVGWGD